MPKQLNVNLAFTADTGKAAANIRSLQQQLTQLMNTATLNSNSLGLTKDIKEATTAVAQLKAQLEGAMTSSGTLDLTKFNDSLKASGMSLEQYRVKLSALGSDGTAAFSQLASSIASAEIPIKRANGLLTEMATTLANTARWQLSSSLLHGFIGGLQSAYGYAQDLNESLNNIRIVTGQSTEQMAQLAQKANQAARELSTRTTDYTNASLIYYQQGLDDKAVEARTRTTLKLANVTRQNVEEVSNQMTAIWNNFDDGTKSLEYYADAITALGAKTASSSSEIADGLSKFASIADTVGLSYEYATAALATVVAETRQSADTVGNAFKSLFARIQSIKLGETLEDGVGLTKYTQALETVGVQVLDINGELREADAILDDLGERWSQISDGQKAALAQTVAGQRQYAQMIALMDNWDKVKENVGIASESEGTLQEQADIYAESWEASAKRVQASAEAIYNALINDKFFIGFNDLISGVLDRVNDLIKGLGGLGGVLTTVGALLTKVFSTQIAGQIDRITHNIKMSTAAGQAQVKSLQDQSITELQKEANSAAKRGSMEGTAQSEGLKGQAVLQRALYDNQQKLNEEQMKTAQHILDQNANLRQQAAEAGKIADLEKARTDTEQKRFLNRVNNLGKSDPLYDPAQTENQINKFRELTEQGTILTDTFEILKGVMYSSDEDPLKIKTLQDNFQKIDPELENFVNKVKSLNGGKMTGLESLLGTLRRDIASFDGSDQSIQKVEQSLDKFLSKVIQLGTQGEGELTSFLQKLGMSETDAKKAVDELTASFEKNGQASADVKAKILALITGANAGTDAIKNMKTAALSLGETLSGLASLTMSLASVVNSIKSAIEIWNNDDLNFGEKLLQIVPALLMSFSMLTNSITGSGLAALKSVASHTLLAAGYTAEEVAATGAAGATTLFGTALKTALPYLFAIAVAIKAVVGIAKLLSNIFADDNNLEEQFKNASDAAERSKTAFENAKTAADNLKASFDNYSTIRSELDNCKQGTQEWYDKLNEVNGQVQGLLQDFPELAKYLTNENGALTISEEGMDKMLNKARTDQYASYGQFIAAENAKSELQVEIDRQSASEAFGEIIPTLTEALDTYSEKQVDNLLNLQTLIDGSSGDNVRLENDAEGNEVAWDAIDEIIKAYSSGETNAKSQTYEDIAARDIIDHYLQSNVDAQRHNQAYWSDEQLEKFGDIDNSEQGLFNLYQTNRDLFDEYWKEFEGDRGSFQDQINSILGGLETVFESPELIGALDTYNASIETSNSLQTAYAESLASMILSSDEAYMANERATELFGAAADKYSLLLNEKQSEIKNQSGEDLISYFKNTSLDGKYVDQTSLNEDGTLKYEKNGTEVILTKDDLINYQAGAEASKELADAMGPLIEKTTNLAESENKADNALGQILERKDISVGHASLSEAINNQDIEDYRSKGGKAKDDYRAQVAAYLHESLGGDDSWLQSSEIKELGFETMSQLIDAVIDGLQQAEKNLEEAEDTGSKFLNKYYEKIKKANEEQISNLGTEEISQIGALLKQSVKNSGYEGLSAMTDILSNTSDLSGTIAALTNGDINWAATSAEELSQYFDDLGISLGNIQEDSLQNLIDSMKQIEGISFESATATFASIHDIIDGIEKNDKIKAEDYQTLIDSVGEDVLDGFFTPMADGTHKLTGDAQEFYNRVNQLSLEEFKQGWQQQTNKVNTAKDLTSTYGEEGTGARKFTNGQELNLFDESQTFNEDGKVIGTYYQQLTQDQLNYLRIIGVEDERLSVVQADLLDNGRLIKENYDILREVLGEHINDWEKVNEGEEQAKKNAQDYVTMMVSSVPNLQELQKLLGTDAFEGMDVNFEDLAEMWKKIFPEQDVIENISTLEDFKNAIEDVNGVKAVKNVDYAWNSVKDKIKLSYDNLKEFKKLEGQISDENFAEGIEEIAKSASNIDELNTVIEAGKGYGIDFTDTIITLLNQSDMTTEEHIKAIIDQLKQGHGEASKLAQEISRLSAENDDEQTTKEAQAERQSNYDQAKAENEAERNRINNSMSMGQEYKEQRNKELDAADRAIDIQSGLDDITAAANAKDMFPTDQLTMFEQGLDKIGNKADLTTIQVRQIGEAAASIVSGSDLFSTAQQLNTIKEAFSNANGEIDPENMKAYADTIKDIVLNADDLTLDQKIATLKEELEGLPLEYIDEELVQLITNSEDLDLEEKLHRITEEGLDLKDSLNEVNELIKEILGNEQTSTIEKLQQLHALLDMGADESSVAQGIADAIDSDETTNIMEKQQTFNAMANSAPEKPGIVKPSQQDSMMGAIDAGDQLEQSKADWAQYSEDLRTYNVELEAYDRWLSNISGKDFSSLDQLRDFSDTIPNLEQLQNSFNEGDAIAEYASQFDRCTDAVRQYNEALAQGKDTSEAIFNMDYLSRVEDAADKYGINADRVQTMAEVYKQQAEAAEDMNQTLLGDIEVEGDAEESSRRMAEAMTDAATRFVRFNDAIEDLRKDGSKVQQTMKKIAKTMEDYGQSAEEVAAGTKDYSEAMDEGKEMVSGLLNVEKKMLKDDFITKHFDKAIDAANDVDGALEDLQAAYAESLSEDVDLGLENIPEEAQAAIEEMGGMSAAADDFMGRLSEMAEGAVIDIDDEPFLQALIAAQLAAGATAGDIESMLSGLGIDADVTPIMGDFEAVKAEAAATGDAVISNTSFDAEATSQTVKNTDTVEAVGYDVEVTPHTLTTTLPKIVSGGSVKHGKDGEEIATAIVSGTTSETGTIDSVSVTPQTEPEESTKEETITGVKVSNAHKSAGGHTSAGNSGGGGGGGGRGGGGGGRRPRSGGGRRPRTTTIRKAAVEHAHTDTKFHMLDKSLETLNKQYADINKSKDLAFGDKHLKAIDAEIAKQDELNKKNKEYLDAINQERKLTLQHLKSSFGFSAGREDDERSIAYQSTSLSAGTKYKKVKKGKGQYVKNSKGKYVKAKKGQGTYNLVEDSNKIIEKENTQYVNVGLKDLGIDMKTDPNTGQITNYDDVIRALDDWRNKRADEYVKNYNTNLKEDATLAEKQQNQNAQNTWNKNEAIYEALKKQIEDYEEYVQKEMDKIDEIIDGEIAEAQSRLEKISYNVDWKVELNEQELERYEFLLESFGDSARNAAKSIGYLGKEIKAQVDNKAYTEGIAELFSSYTKQYQIFQGNGAQYAFNKDGATEYYNGTDIVNDLKKNGTKSKYIDDIRSMGQMTNDDRESLLNWASSEMSRVSEIANKREEMFNRMNSAVDEYLDKLDYEVSQQESLLEISRSYLDVVELVGKSNMYTNEKGVADKKRGRKTEEDIDTQLNKQVDTRLAGIKREQEAVNNMLDKEKEKYEKLKEIMEKTTDEAVKEDYENELEKFEDSLRTLTEQNNALLLEQQQALIDALTQKEEAFERALTRAAEAFDESMSNIRGTLEVLQGAMDLRQKVMDTYVADYEKVHQLRQLDLEAQESIDKANDPKIQKELLAIQEEITARAYDGEKVSQYELDYLRQKLELKQAEAAMDDAQKAKTQVSLTRDNEGNFGYVYTADEGNVAEAEKNYEDKIYEMRKSNAEYINQVEADLVQSEIDYQNAMQEVAMNKDLDESQKLVEMQRISDEYYALHQNLTDQLKIAMEATDDIYGQYSDIYSEITGDLMAKQADYAKSFGETILGQMGGYDSLDERTKAWEDSFAAYNEAMKKSVSDYGDQCDATYKAIDTTASDYLSSATTKTSDYTNQMKNLGDTIDSVATKAQTGFAGIVDAISKEEEKYLGHLTTWVNETNNLAEAIQLALSSMNELEGVVNDLSDYSEYNPLNKKRTRTTNNSGGPKVKRTTITYGRRSRRTRRRVTITGLRDKDLRRLTRKQARTVLRAIGKRGSSIRKAKKEIKKQIKNGMKKVMIWFDTGGYTGDWSGNDGRVAMLHKKEMVLNQQDTSNILSAVGMIRDIAQKIDLNALSQSGALSSGISGINGVSNGTLEQEVHITAEFPNATDRNEISEAFNNIIGLAAQYANR